MTHTELILVTNARMEYIANQVKLGNNIKNDRQLTRAFAEYFSENLKGLSSTMKERLAINLTDFSSAKTKTIIDDIMKNKTDLDQVLDGMKDKYNNYSLVEEGITKSHVIQVKQFDLWTSKKGSFLQYVTAEDDKVRDPHVRLNGLIRPVSDPIWKEIAPRVAYNCRCTLKHLLKAPYVSTSIPSLEGVRDSGIAKNTYYTGLIFDQKHSYFNG